MEAEVEWLPRGLTQHKPRELEFPWLCCKRLGQDPAHYRDLKLRPLLGHRVKIGFLSMKEDMKSPKSSTRPEPEASLPTLGEGGTTA